MGGRWTALHDLALISPKSLVAGCTPYVTIAMSLSNSCTSLMASGRSTVDSASNATRVGMDGKLSKTYLIAIHFFFVGMLVFLWLRSACERLPTNSGITNQSTWQRSSEACSRRESTAHSGIEKGTLEWTRLQSSLILGGWTGTTRPNPRLGGLSGRSPAPPNRAAAGFRGADLAPRALARPPSSEASAASAATGEADEARGTCAATNHTPGGRAVACSAGG